jgi:hypothetical protein
MCELYNDDCRYDKPPPMSQLVAMAKRLQDAEKAVSDMQTASERASNDAVSADMEDPNATNITLQQYSPSLSLEHPHASLHRLSNSSAQLVTSRPNMIDRSWEDGTSVSSQTGHSSRRNDAIAPEVTVDEHGEIRYYGPTSAVHEPSPASIPTFSEPGVQTSNSPRTDVHITLAAHAQESAIWEEFAIGNASLQTGIPPHVIARLLHIHWTWVAPMFLWIHRPTFIRTLSYIRS